MELKLYEKEPYPAVETFFKIVKYSFGIIADAQIDRPFYDPHHRTRKTHRFSEHAIVYSMKAIAFATNIRTIATVAESNRTISGEKQ